MYVYSQRLEDMERWELRELLIGLRKNNTYLERGKQRLMIPNCDAILKVQAELMRRDKLDWERLQNV